jgi:hypothetical protein
MSTTLDEQMEQASQALARMDYLACEALCVQALAEAREQARWAYYARILLPLQEARRQRRQMAADGTIRLGTASLSGQPTDWLQHLQAGCIVVTEPHGPEQAQALMEAARQAKQHLEVLYAANEPSANPWAIRSFAGPRIEVERAAPPASWVDRWLEANAVPEPAPAGHSQTPADWFLDASEALGDAAIDKVEARTDAIPGGDQRVALLEQMLQVVTDHEILHQKLGDAARAIH